MTGYLGCDICWSQSLPLHSTTEMQNERKDPWPMWDSNSWLKCSSTGTWYMLQPITGTTASIKSLWMVF